MRISFAALDPSSFAGDLLIALVPASGHAAAIAGLDGPQAYAGALAAVVAEEEFTGKACATVQVHGLGRISARRLLLVGTGGGTATEIHNAAGIAGSVARTRGARSIGIWAAEAHLDRNALRGLLEGVGEGNYRFDKYKSESSRKARLEAITMIGVPEDAVAVRHAVASIQGQDLARDLVNEPPSEIYPESLAAVAAGLADERISVSILDENEIREKGMGGIYGVGQGSVRPPRFVHLRYEPSTTARAHVAVIGKGVTFDSGGLSLKPNDGMLTMRCDMAGSAAVIGMMKALAVIQPHVRVDAIFGAVENMPSGNSYKLGDILKMYNGKRVEVHNTDAEGRLVLADCLTYASELKPDAVVDLATLTGAAVVALGDWYTAMYSRSDELAGQLSAAAAAAGEGVWRMPLPDLYMDKLKAEWGDLKNVGGRAGGSITAALFLSEFVTVPKWAHLDIAGPAFFDSPLMHYVPGGTGTMVRSLVRWVESLG